VALVCANGRAMACILPVCNSISGKAACDVLPLFPRIVPVKPYILSQDEQEALRRQVAVRDNYRCILHPKRLGGSIHHIIHRSFTKSRSATIWQKKNMCVLCTECHPTECHKHPLEMRRKLLKKMAKLYGYDYRCSPFREYLIEEEE